MERSRPSRWRCPKAVVLFVLALWPASASGPTNTTEHADVPLLDWSKWDEPPPNPGRGRTEPTVGTPTMRFVDSSCLPGACQQQQLRRLVHECSRQLKLPGLGCGDSFVTDDDYRVPLFESLPSCGFEAPTTKDAIEHLAARYTFRFIGDSTTRRLTESFMSIVTGEGSAHPKVQERIDFSTGDLKVIFDWAPFCSGPLSVGEMLKTVMDEESAPQEGEGINKRPIVVTAFGVHDASYQLQVSQKNVKDWYRDQMPQEIFKQDGFRAAGLAACRQATAQFVRAATGADAARAKAELESPSPPEEENQERGDKGEEEEEGGREHDGGRRMQEIQLQQWRRRRRRRLQAGVEAVPGDAGRGDATQSNVSVDSNDKTNEGGEGSVSDGASVSGSVSRGLAPPPLVFVLQNNGYYNDPHDFQQMFLEEVRTIQRQEIGIRLTAEPEVAKSTSGGVGEQNDDRDTLGSSKIVSVDDEGAGVFLVDDSESLFRRLSCYRIEPSSHYHEPVKIVEGKVLWDLIALADRVSGPAPATHGGSSDVSGSGRVGLAVSSAVVGIATAVVLSVVESALGVVTM